MKEIDQKHLVSVIMPVYNSQNYLTDAIESVLNQTYKNFEFIIIDDYSTDRSWEIIKKYSDNDKRIKKFRNKKNLGIAKTRNKGFKLVKKNSKYYAIFDSDDILTPNRIEEQVKFLEKNENYALIGSHIIIIDNDGKEIGIRRYKTNNLDIKKRMFFYNPIAQSAVMIRASVLEEVGYYDENYSGCEDYDLWLRVAEKYKIANINKPLVKYRISPTQFKTTRLKETLRMTINIQKKWLSKKNSFNALAVINLIYDFIIVPTYKDSPYGSTKISGSFGDAVSFGMPFLLPNYYAEGYYFPENIIRFDDDSLENTLLDCINIKFNKNEYIKLKNSVILYSEKLSNVMKRVDFTNLI